MVRLLNTKLYGPEGGKPVLDAEGRVRVDDWEMAEVRPGGGGLGSTLKRPGHEVDRPHQTQAKGLGAGKEAQSPPVPPCLPQDVQQAVKDVWQQVQTASLKDLTHGQPFARTDTPLRGNPFGCSRGL